MILLNAVCVSEAPSDAPSEAPSDAPSDAPSEAPLPFAIVGHMFFSEYFTKQWIFIVRCVDENKG